MALTATFAYNNLDATSDLNLHFKALFAKGFISGGDITAVPSTSNVSVGPFFATSADGMIVRNDTPIVVSCVPGQLNYIVLRAVYNAPAAPTLLVECLSQANLASDPQAANLAVFGTVNLVGASQASTSAIDYSARNTVDVNGHNPFLGVYGSQTLRDAAWPSTAPVKQKPNDFVLVLSDSNAKPAFHVWSGTGWSAFGNYESMATAFATHVAGLGTLGGLQVHVDSDEKAALAGTYGTPGAGNRYVTENDTTKLLTVDEKAAIDGTITGPNPLSATNPLVADGIPLAVTKIVGATFQAASSFVVVQRGTTGNNVPAFDAPVYTGKLGLDSAHGNVSSSKYWFKLMDSAMNGYVDADGPLYVVDIKDQSGAGSYNPASDNTNVSQSGYWDPATPATGLRVVFNRTVAAGRTVYIGFNAMGSVSQAAPSSPYDPPSTGFHSGIEAFQNVDTQVVSNQVVSSSTITKLVLGSGTSAIPSVSFPVLGTTGTVPTGFYSNDALSTSAYAMHKSVAVSVGGDPLVLVGKVSPIDNFGTAPTPLGIRLSGGDNVQVGVNYDGASTAYPRLSIGFADRTAGWTDTLMFHAKGGPRATGGFMQAYAPLTMVPGAQIIASDGTEALPGLTFSDNTTGFYRIGTHTDTDLTTYNTIGLSMKGRTAFVFSTNTASQPDLETGMYRPLMFEQNYDSAAGLIDYRIAITESTDNVVTVGAIRFGKSGYSSDFSEWGNISDTGLQVSGRGTFTSNLSITSSDTATTYLRMSGTSTSFSFGGASTQEVIKYTASNTTTTIKGAIVTTGSANIAGSVTTANGTEATPAYGFNSAAGTGIFYAGNISSTDNQFNTQSGVGVAVGGASVVVFSRHEAVPAGLGTVTNPLIIEQSLVDSDSEIRLIAFDRVSTEPNNCRISIGGASYQSEYSSYMDFRSGLVTANVSFVGSAGITSSNYKSTTSSSASSVAYGIGSNTTGLFGNSSAVSVSLAGATALTVTASTLTVPGLTVRGRGTSNNSLIATLEYDSDRSSFETSAPILCVSSPGGADRSVVFFQATNPLLYPDRTIEINDAAIRHIHIDDNVAYSSLTQNLTLSFQTLRAPVAVYVTLSNSDGGGAVGIRYYVRVSVAGVAATNQQSGRFTLCARATVSSPGAGERQAGPMCYIMPGNNGQPAYLVGPTYS